VQKEIENKLRENGIKITKHRKTIINIMINKKKKHITCEEIYRYAKNKGEEISIPTIYRNVSLLREIGILCKHKFNDKSNIYELSIKGRKNHFHLKCRKCGQILEMENKLSTELIKRIENEKNFNIKSWELIIYGICSKCLNKGKFKVEKNRLNYIKKN